ncbi:DNA polymerase III subunit delta' [Dactylosporangium vinaceum]|uniref:DNA polymerase III subunit delta n=1 Tax=Dactylosporangium vinaceum TaxID=53362 RepID=A0ABV5M199_9ACTN|nr:MULTISPECIES: DNA polymerase III subunit delta' [Dactylosporangium]UAB97216.1 DNA polymerase III subunit delta' [Dactylosporangium vinaceum]UWZ45503.1 DNA polymerase III subunit delta' [Dactylosporangium matsuzakiense]
MTPPIFEELVGQADAVATLSRAVAAADAIVRGDEPDAAGQQAMTHAWLFTGPPGSGRSVAARTFAAALQCPNGGCGTCRACHTALTGTHADVRFVVPEGLSIAVGEMRALVLRAASAPTQGRWQVLLVEDADRLTEAAGNALLKAVEEPPARTVFLLCTPSTHPDDISVTIRSRCRVVPLRQPPAEAIASVLHRRDGVDPETAAWAAAASQGHVGRARRLARDPQARSRRDAVLAVPRRLTGIGAAFDAASALIEAAEAEAAASVAEVDTKERSALETALGAGGTGKGAAGAVRGSAGQLKELERRQKSRATRAQRDSLDRALVDLAGFYRDVIAHSFKADVAPVHGDVDELAGAAAEKWSPESTLRRLEAILECRVAIEANVKPRIAVEAMMLSLWRG